MRGPRARLSRGGERGVAAQLLTDKHSWRSGGTPLLFDGNDNKKPAYDAVLSALGGSGGDNGGGDNGGGSGVCTVSCEETDRWGDSLHGRVTVRAGNQPISNWRVTVTVRSPQRISTTWNGTPSRDSGGNVMTMRPNGNGSLPPGAATGFGFTVMANGNWTAPTIGSCSAGRPAGERAARPATPGADREGR